MSKELVTIKNSEELALIREGGRQLGRILGKIAQMVKPGVSTAELEEAAEKMIREVGGRPSFRGYHTRGEIPYPTALCTSINEEVVHAPAVPGRILKAGDNIGIDIGMEWPYPNGYYTDTATTVKVGQVSKEVEKLIKITQKSLAVGIAAAKPGNSIADIGKAIENFVKKQDIRIGIVRDLVGHGVGYGVHEAPRIPNYFDPTLSKVEIKPGQVLAIEPMLTLGECHIETGPDGFSIRTCDASWSAHFEHTVIITEKGAEVVT